MTSGWSRSTHRALSFLNPKTGIRIRPLEPGDPGYGPESEAFFKAFMESEPGDEFDTALRKKLGELADEGGEDQGEAQRHQGIRNQ